MSNAIAAGMSLAMTFVPYCVQSPYRGAAPMLVARFDRHLARDRDMRRFVGRETGHLDRQIESVGHRCRAAQGAGDGVDLHAEGVALDAA